MRKYRIKFLALLLITSAAFFSCKKGDPIPPRMPITAAAPATNNPTFTRGEWRISLFSANDMDQTSRFSAYVFMFNSDGSIKVKKDSSIIEGRWSSMPGTNQRFMINFPSAPLNELNEDWQIKGETYNDLRLEHVRGANGEMDYLTFKRNQLQAPAHSSK